MELDSHSGLLGGASTNTSDNMTTPAIFNNWSYPWGQLTSGAIIQSTISPFTAILGTWFYLILLFVALMMVYFKTNNFGTTIVTGLVISAGFFPYLVTLGGYEAAMPAVYMMIVFGIFIILYRLFK
jgi:hypothetical protein